MFILRALMVVLSTIFFGSISVAVSFFDPEGRRQNSVARTWARSLLWVGGVKVRIEGLERILPDAGYVIASNHVSYMDTPVVLANMPVQFRFLAKRGLFKIPFLGNHLSRAGHIPVPREDPRAAVKTMSLAAEIIRERGISVLIFPEGGRSRDGELQTVQRWRRLHWHQGRGSDRSRGADRYACDPAVRVGSPSSRAKWC